MSRKRNNGQAGSARITDPSSTGTAAVTESGGQKLLRRTFRDPVLIGLLGLTAALAVWGVLRTSADPEDASLLTMFLLWGTPTIPAAWSVVRVLWSEEAREAFLIALARTLIVPVAAAVPPAVAATITVHVPAIQRRIVATQNEYGWRTFFAEQDGSPLLQSAVLMPLVGMICAMLLGLVLSIVIVLPILVWLKPIGTAESNMLLTETEADRAAATSSIRLIAVVLIMALAVPALIVFGKRQARASTWWEAFANAPRVFREPEYFYGDLLWALGVAAIPLGIGLALLIRRMQRPDIEKRAQHGVNARADQERWERRQGGGASPRTRRSRPGKTSR